MKIRVDDKRIFLGATAYNRYRLDEIADKENLRIVYHNNIIIVKGLVKISKEIYSVQGRSGVFFIVRADAPAYLEDNRC